MRATHYSRHALSVLAPPRRNQPLAGCGGAGIQPAEAFSRSLLVLVCLALALPGIGFAQASFRYFYDDAGELFRVLDSTGTLIEYDYDAGGNIIQVNRSTVPPPSLAILNITPLSGPSGTTVTIYGQNFSSTAASDLVQFGGVTATVVSASSGALVVQVPTGIGNGQISVTVNGVTATSGTLTFTPPPSITSITPYFGYVGQTLTGVVIEGGNLAGATFTLSGGGTVTTVSSTPVAATVNITLGQTPGPSVLIATNNSGSSTSLITSGDYLVVYNTAGSNYFDMLFSVFNATGITPNFPAGKNLTGQTFSVFNATGSTPNFPPGTNIAGQTFSVFNATGSTPDFPPGTNWTDQTFSVFNATGSTPNFPAGTNWAWQLFSTENTSDPPPASLPISISQNGRRADTGGIDGTTAPLEQAPVNMFAGQTVEIAVRPDRFLHYLELDADGEPLASTSAGSLSLPLTAPYGVESFSLRAFGLTSTGSTTDSLTETVHVDPDPGRTISGQAVDGSGAPLAGKLIGWQAQGLAADYFGFAGDLREMPDLRGGPVRRSILGALNYPNPHQVFGPDPMGAHLGPNYAVRLTGKIQVTVEGWYQFELLAHRGARLSIDGEVIAQAAATGADALSATGGVNLTAGGHTIEVTHFESGGAAALQLLWTPPGGLEQVVPPSAITADAPPSWRAITDGGGRFVLHVPAALNGVTVKLVAGEGSVQLDQ